MIKIIDFATDFDEALWDNFQSTLSTTVDKLKNNYVELDPRTFAAFPVVVIDNTIVCFSALQLSPDRWGSNIGRVSTRMWIHPDHRHRGKFVGGERFLNTTYCLPRQLKQARELGLDCVFISREGTPRAFSHYLDLIYINCSEQFVLEKTQYNVCGAISPVPVSCQQWVATLSLTDDGTTIWKQDMERYRLP